MGFPDDAGAGVDTDVAAEAEAVFTPSPAILIGRGPGEAVATLCRGGEVVPELGPGPAVDVCTPTPVCVGVVARDPPAEPDFGLVL